MQNLLQIIKIATFFICKGQGKQYKSNDEEQFRSFKFASINIKNQLCIYTRPRFDSKYKNNAWGGGQTKIEKKKKKYGENVGGDNHIRKKKL